jgi:hypothetical protein
MSIHSKIAPDALNGSQRFEQIVPAIKQDWPNVNHALGAWFTHA